MITSSLAMRTEALAAIGHRSLLTNSSGRTGFQKLDALSFWIVGLLLAIIAISPPHRVPCLKNTDNQENVI